MLLGSVVLIGILVGLCGIGLSFGLRKLSVISFFSAIGLLILFHFIIRTGNSGKR